MILDLFAGPGGWDVGARSIGLDPVGVELDKDACATRAAAGLRTIRASVPDFAARPVEGLIASPPCTAFSQAGKRSGIDHLGALRDAIWASDWTARPSPDPAVWLALEVGRFIEEAQPEWVVCEQVPQVLPLWEAYRERLLADGWHAWAGVLHAEEYGVPQTRKRAFLIAHRSRPIGPPTPTHQRYMPRQADRGRDGLLLPWVSMADALGWTGAAGFPRRNDLADGAEYRERDLRSSELPAFGITEKARSWVVSGSTQSHAAERAADEPAPTIANGNNAGPLRLHTNRGQDEDGRRQIREGSAPAVTGKSGGQWKMERLPGLPEHGVSADVADRKAWADDRPATTIAGRPLVPDPGATANRYNGATKSRNDGIKVGLPEVLVLQSFPADYPVQGSRTSQFRQVGNAIPPLLAAAVLGAVVGP